MLRYEKDMRSFQILLTYSCNWDVPVQINIRGLMYYENKFMKIMEDF